MNTKSMTVGVIWAAVLIASALGLKSAQHAHLIDADVALRGEQVMIGLGLAFYGNYIPKNLRSASSATVASRMQSAQRVAGWGFMLAGLIYAALSAFAPHGIGETLAMLAVFAAVVVTVIYSVICAASRRHDQQNGAA
jgi:uncharacterized membrane protein